MLKFTPIVILLVAATPAIAQAPATSTTEATPKAKPNPLDRIVCRTEEGLGSRLNVKKVCMSLREWKDQADDSRDALERIQQGQGVTVSH